MKNIIIYAVLIFFPIMLFSQVDLVVNGVDFKVMALTDVKIDNGGVTNTNSATINNEGNIYIDLDWTQTGMLTSYTGNGWMWYEGTVDQTIFGPSVITVPKLRVDNGQKLILDQDVDVTASVDLINGMIELGTNNLTLSSTGVISNYDDSSFIITNGTGVLHQTVIAGNNTVFPIGTAGTSYTPATLTNLGSDEDFKVRVKDQALQYGDNGSPLTDHVVDKTWLIDDSGLGSPNIILKLQWNASEELGSFNRMECGIAHKETPGSWDNPPIIGGFTPAQVVSTGVFEQSRSGFTNFSPFIVRDITIFLSKDLLSFNAKRLNADLVKLDWAMATETDNKGFEIQRMLENETVFKTIGFVEGQGTTTNTTYYKFNDVNSYTDISYYRLKQVDLDNSFTYSEIRSVAGMKDDDPSYVDINTYPNPVVDELIIEFKKIPKGVKNATIKLINVAGQLLCQFDHEIKYNQFIEIEYVKHLVPAAYMLTIELDNGHRITEKFIKK